MSKVQRLRHSQAGYLPQLVAHHDPFGFLVVLQPGPQWSSIWRPERPLAQIRKIWPKRCS
jgi:hypothetical protein